MKNKKLIIIICIILLLIIGIIITYNYLLTPVNTNGDDVTFVISSGDSKEMIVNNLKDAGLIRSKYATLGYMLLSKNTNMQAGSYSISSSLSTKEIINIFNNGDIIRKDRPSVTITFKEGLTIDDYLKLISENTNLEYDDIKNEINDKSLLNSLIDNYDFLNDDILDDGIYYPLEGYLYPNTYTFYKETTLSEVLRKILDTTDKYLKDYEEEINNSNYSIHDILTMASITEKEANSYEDRTKVAQVIYKRLELGMNLGMDVTSYYGVQKSMKETLTQKDLSDSNPYNTRNSSLIGLPIGPICNPSIESIKAVLNPADTDYIYFFADVSTGKVYFTDSYDEFNSFKAIYG